MKGYSLDLRERVIHSWQSGKRQLWIAQHLEVSVSTVKGYISQYRTQGHVKAKVQQYKQPTIRDEQLETLSQQLAAHPDDRLEDHIVRWAEDGGQRVSTSMMWRAIDRAGWTRKKRQWRPKRAMS